MEAVGGEVYKAEGTTEPIDIILITHGNIELTVPCVRAIYENTHNLFHLIVVDDSTPELDGEKEFSTPLWFRRCQIEQQNITFIHSDKPYKSGNQIFNIGLSAGNSRFIATIMNSIIVEPDWDVVPVQMMASNPKIGITGLKCLKLGWDDDPKENRHDGQIECAGIYMNNFTPCDMGRDEPGHRRTTSYPCFSLQWAFALLRREAVIGNLDEDLWRGYLGGNDWETQHFGKGFVGWDDIDNTIYLRYKGWEAWYCGLGVGYHRTHATRGSASDDVLLRNRINAEIFYKRWGYWDAFRVKNPYAPEYFPNGGVKFLCNANEMPLEIPKPQVTDIVESGDIQAERPNNGKIELIPPQPGSRSTK